MINEEKNNQKIYIEMFKYLKQFVESYCINNKIKKK